MIKLFEEKITHQYSENDEHNGSVSVVESVHEVPVPSSSDLGDATDQTQREHDQVLNYTNTEYKKLYEPDYN